MGGVILADDIEIGSATAIDAGTFVPTRIGSGCKIDNGVQIGHNCNVKNGVIFCGHSGLSGSCTIGNYVVFGGKSGTGPDVILEDGCQIAGGALVSKNWPMGSKLAGHPARLLKDWFKANAFIQNGINIKKQELIDENK
jgi:UDP-3-O-[3-hydroxymyristoyl] glucosamine N-acyltransferase